MIIKSLFWLLIVGFGRVDDRLDFLNVSHGVLGVDVRQGIIADVVFFHDCHHLVTVDVEETPRQYVVSAINSHDFVSHMLESEQELPQVGAADFARGILVSTVVTVRASVPDCRTDSQDVGQAVPAPLVSAAVLLRDLQRAFFVVVLPTTTFARSGR